MGWEGRQGVNPGLTHAAGFGVTGHGQAAEERNT